MKAIKLSEISISPHRQRKELSAEAIMELANSIAKNGLLHPPVVRSTSSGPELVAGFRRLQAIQTLWSMGEVLRYGDATFMEGFIPTNDLGDLDNVDAFEAELEENLRREDLSWPDRCTATSQLYELRSLQAEKAGQGQPTTRSLADELYPDQHEDASQKAVRKELILARHLSDPDVAAARSMDEGIKVIKRKEENARSVALGEAVGRTFSAADHLLILGDCLSCMQRFDDSTFDVILTDPPYGISAQDFNDSGGKADARGHTYDDSYANWLSLMGGAIPEFYRLGKAQSHLYIFCDIDNFLELRGLVSRSGWKCFRTPLIWHNPTSQRAPWPQHGPHRRYQICLYAMKGERPVLKLGSDVVTYASDQNLGWAAQKPEALYTDFLSRSCRAGDSVLDPFCGSGTVFAAAHGLKVKAVGIEQDPIAYGIAVKRLGEL